jgi:molybdenum cofactor cytidylyltransferase
LLRINGVSFLELIVGAMLDSGFAPIVVVLGAQAQAVKETFENLDVDFIINKNWHMGQFSSLKTGLVTLQPNIPGAMISLIDHPTVKKETYKLHHHVLMENLDKIILPIYQGRRGHPIVIPKKIIDEILGASDEMNLKDIIKIHSELVFEQLVDDPGILQDIDTQNDLRIIGKSWA